MLATKKHETLLPYKNSGLHWGYLLQWRRLPQLLRQYLQCLGLKHLAISHVGITGFCPIDLWTITLSSSTIMMSTYYSD